MDKYIQFENSLFEQIDKEFSKFNKDSILILQKAAEPYYTYINSFRNYLNIKNLKFDKSALMSFEFFIRYSIKDFDFELLNELYRTVSKLHELVRNDEISKESVDSVFETYRIADSSNHYNQFDVASIFDTAGFHAKAETEFNCAESILSYIRDNQHKFYLMEKYYSDQNSILDDVFSISRNDTDIILKTFIKSGKAGNYFHLISSRKSLKEICDSYTVNSFDILSSSTMYFSMLDDTIEVLDSGERSLVTGSSLSLDSVLENNTAEITKSDFNTLHAQIKELNTIKHKMNNFSTDSSSTEVSESLLSITETLESFIYKSEMRSFDEVFNNLRKFLPEMEQEYGVELRLVTVSSGSNVYKSEERNILFRLLRFIRLIISFQKDYRSYEFSELKIRIEVIPAPDFNVVKLMAFDFYDNEDMENGEFQQQSLSRLHHFVRDICEATETSYLNRHNCLILSCKTENPDVLHSYVVFGTGDKLFCVNDIFLNRISSVQLDNLLKIDNSTRLGLAVDNTDLPLYFTDEVFNMKEYSHEDIPLNRIDGKKILHIQIHGNEIGIICDNIINSGKFTSMEIPEILASSLPVVSGFIEYRNNELLPVLRIDHFVAECSTAVILDLVDSSGFERDKSDKETMMTFLDSGLKLSVEKNFVSEILEASGNLRKIGNRNFFTDGERTYPVISLNDTEVDDKLTEDGYILCIDKLVHTFGVYASEIDNFVTEYDIVKPEKTLTNFAENYIKINDSKYLALMLQRIHDFLFSELKLELKNGSQSKNLITN